MTKLANLRMQCPDLDWDQTCIRDQTCNPVSRSVLGLQTPGLPKNGGSLLLPVIYIMCSRLSLAGLDSRASRRRGMPEGIADAPGNAKRYNLYNSEGVKGTHQTKRRPWPVISTKCRTWASRERHRRGGDAHARCNTAPTARAASSVVAKVAAGVVASKGQFSWRRRRSS